MYQHRLNQPVIVLEIREGVKTIIVGQWLAIVQRFGEEVVIRVEKLPEL